MKDKIEPEVLLIEAETLLEAAWNSTDDRRYDQLISWAREIIEPLANSNYPPALWLKCSLPYDAELSEEEVDKLHSEQLELAAKAGNVDAKFSLAVELDEEPTLKRSALLFKEAAEAGHAHAMWCHGLNLLSGHGIDKDEQEGLRFIMNSAELKFEGAIQFVADAYAKGTHGFTQDDQASALWWKKLSSPGVIPY